MTTDRATNDSLLNTLSGLGDEARDKGRSNGIDTKRPQLTPAELEALYEWDGFARRIIDLPVDESTRKGWSFTVDDADSDEGADPFTDYHGRLRVLDAFAEADRWAELFGGAAILMGIDDGQKADRPLNPDAIQTIKWLRVVDRHEATPHSYYTADAENEEKIGEVETYLVQPYTAGTHASFVMHESRMLIFRGPPVSRRARARYQDWSPSRLQVVWDVLSTFGMTHKAIGHLLHEWRLGILQVQGLAEMVLGPDGSTLLSKRLAAINLSKSITGTIVLDERETYTQQSVPVTGLHELYDRMAQALAGAAGMPVTLLMGQAPGGLSTDDSGGRTYWYDLVAARQRRRYLHHLERLADLTRRAKDGPDVPLDAEIRVEFAPLQEMSDKERSELRERQSQTDERYWKMGALDEVEIRESRFGGSGYSGDTRLLDAEARQEVAERDGLPFDAAGPELTEQPPGGEPGAPLVPPGAEEPPAPTPEVPPTEPPVTGGEP